MSGSENLMAVLKDVGVQTPTILVALVCSILAIVRWHRHPRVSLIVLISMVLILIHLFVFAVVYAWAPDWIINSASDVSRATASRNVYITLAVIYNCLEVVPFALLVIAIFWRRPTTEFTPA